jgi:hypothetical protein
MAREAKNLGRKLLSISERRFKLGRRLSTLGLVKSMQPPPDIPPEMGPAYDPAEAMMMLAAIQAGYILPGMMYGYDTPLGDSAGLPTVTDNLALRNDAHTPQHLQHIPLPSLPSQPPRSVPFPPGSRTQAYNAVPPPPFAFVNPLFFPPVQYQTPFAFPNYPVDSPPPPTPPLAPRQLKRPALQLPNKADKGRVKRARMKSETEADASRAFEPRIDPSRQALIAMPQSPLTRPILEIPGITGSNGLPCSAPRVVLPTSGPAPSPLRSFTNTKDDPCPAELFVPPSSNTSLPPCILYTEQSLAEAWTYISSTEARSPDRKSSHFLILRHHLLSLIWRFAVTQDKREYYITPHIQGNGIGLLLGLLQGFSCKKIGTSRSSDRGDEFVFRLGMRVWIHTNKSSFWSRVMADGEKLGIFDSQKDREGLERLKVAWDEAQNRLLAPNGKQVDTISTANSETSIPAAKAVISDLATGQASTATTKSEIPITVATVRPPGQRTC